MLPFLKSRKWPRIAPKQEEKLVNAPVSDHLEDHCVSELWAAVPTKDVKSFRSALLALVMNCFDYDGEDDK